MIETGRRLNVFGITHHISVVGVRLELVHITRSPRVYRLTILVISTSTALTAVTRTRLNVSVSAATLLLCGYSAAFCTKFDINKL